MNIILFGKNFSIYGLSNVVLRAASFLLVPLYTHSLSVRDYGLLTALILTIEIMLIYMNMGTRLALLRFTLHHEKTNTLNQLFGTTLSLNLLGFLLVSVLTLFLLKPFFRLILHTEHITPLLHLTLVAAFVQSLTLHLMQYYRAKSFAITFFRFELLTAIIILLSNLALVVIFGYGIHGALTANILAYSFVLTIIAVDLIPKFGFSFSKALVPKVLRFGVPLTFSMSGQFLIGSATLYFLSYFLGLETAAIYALGYKLAQLSGIVITLPFSLAFQPFVFANLGSPDIKDSLSRLLTYLLAAVACTSFFILLCSRLILPVIAPPEYAASYSIIVLLLPAMASAALYCYWETILSALQKTFITGSVMGACSVLSVVLNLVLIPTIGWGGAIISLNFSYLLVVIVFSYYCMKNFPIPIEVKRISITIGFYTLLLLSAYFLYDFGNFAFYTMFLLLALVCALSLNFLSFCNENDLMLLKAIAGRIRPTRLSKP